MSSRRFASLLVIAPLVAAVGTLAGYLIAGAHRRLGVTLDETQKALPGDELLPLARVQNDRACTIHEPPGAVWPWIAQLGQDRAGFYSFEFLENLVGCQITGATSVHPQWQDVKPGDSFFLHPEVALRVAQVEPGSHLVVTSQGGDAPGEMDFESTWGFYLSPAAGSSGEPATRLHLRERYETPSMRTRAMIEVTSIISAAMTWRMMSQLTKLVTSARTTIPGDEPLD